MIDSEIEYGPDPTSSRRKYDNRNQEKHWRCVARVEKPVKKKRRMD